MVVLCGGDGGGGGRDDMRAGDDTLRGVTSKLLFQPTGSVSSAQDYGATGRS